MTELQRDDRETGRAAAPDGPGEQVVYETGGVRLVLLIAGTLAIGFLWGWWYVGMILGVGIMIFLHELGHYLTARWSGMKVTQFFIGFGPRVWSYYRGETEYGIKALPVGAYVRIIGMNNLDPVEAADEPRAFRHQSFPKRMLVMCAGSMAHFIQAFVLLVVLLGVVGVPGGTLTRNADEWTIDKVTPGSAADRAGLERGDQIVALDGTPVSHWPAITEAIPNYHAEDTVDVAFERDGESLVKAIQLGTRPADLGGDPTSAFLGVGTRPPPVEKLGIGGAILAVPGETARFVNQSAHAMAGLFTPNGIGDMAGNVTNAQRDRDADNSGAPSSAEETDRQQHRLISILGVIQLGGSIGEDNGIAILLLLFFEMNIFIGIFNMIPLPPLDGGHAAVAIYERARSRKGQRYYADATKLLPLTYAVVMGLVVLGVATMYLDIVNPINT
jgi:membrane-associated protease RseP (regulator of RpoE activity)